MAALTHMAVGLAAKPAAPKIPLAFLILSAYTIDLVWGIFYFLGIEHMPEEGIETVSYWSHSLFMSVVWSLLAGFLVWFMSRNSRTSLIIGLLVFSHWVIDFISHPMTAVFPHDTGLPLLFEGSPLVGLGLWRTQFAVSVGEYGLLALGAMIYLVSLYRLRKRKHTTPAQIC